MTVPVVLLLLQAGTWSAAPDAPTVGDTVRLSRAVPVAAGVRARPRPLDPSDLLEPLGEPTVRRVTGGVVLSYPVALFRPGPHAIAMPAMELVYPDGAVETVVGDTARVDVASVLPADTVPPRHSRAPLARPVRRGLPAVVLPLLAVLGLAVWIVARRRRGPDLPPVPPLTEPPPDPLMRWLDAGEGRAAASFAMTRLRERVTRHVPEAGPSLATDECLRLLEARRPDWPLRELGDLLRELDRARFAPLAPSDAGDLVDRTGLMLDHLDQLVREEAVEEAAEAP